MQKTFQKLIQTRNVVLNEIKKSDDDSERYILEEVILKNIEKQISLIKHLI